MKVTGLLLLGATLVSAAPQPGKVGDFLAALQGKGGKNGGGNGGNAGGQGNGGGATANGQGNGGGATANGQGNGGGATANGQGNGGGATANGQGATNNGQGATNNGQGATNQGATQGANNAGMTAQGPQAAQMQAGSIVNGGMNTGNMGATTATQGATNQGTQTNVAPGNAVSAIGLAPGQNPFQALAQSNASVQGLTATQQMGLQMAANLWAQDTAVVSSALQTMGSVQMSDADFRDTADAAYVAEVNELMQKNYIDALIGTQPELQAATTSLGNGSFAIVVDQLREARVRGQANQTFVQAAVQGMNNLRCRQVLLAIDTYVQSANNAAGNTSAITATRPPACAQIYAQTADVLPAGAITNATSFPNANQLITQFNQPPRFMISNGVAFSQNSGSDATGALGSQYINQAPITNTSSLSGQLLAFQGQAVQTNGDPNNAQANPINQVLNLQPNGTAATGTVGTAGTNGTTAGVAGASGTATAGQANQGATNNGQANQGATNNGQANQGATNNGQANQGATNNGQANQGATNNGQANQGATNNGQANQGATNNGQGATNNQGNANQGNGGNNQNKN